MSNHDTRSWKCLFGLHQWEKFRTTERRQFDCPGDRMPFRITTIYVLKCVHCGKLKSYEI